MLIDFNIIYVSECLLSNITWRICQCCTRVGLFLFYSKTIADVFYSLEAATSSSVHMLLLRMRRVNAYLVSVRLVPPRLVTVLYSFTCNVVNILTEHQ